MNEEINEEETCGQERRSQWNNAGQPGAWGVGDQRWRKRERVKEERRGGGGGVWFLVRGHWRR